MKTKKQKSNEIPFLEKSIEELNHDLHLVQHAFTNAVIETEIKKLEKQILQYKKDIAN